MDTSGTATPGTPRHGSGVTSPRSRQRIKHLIHPDGRSIHVVQTPEENVKLRTELSKTTPDGDFDVIIQGTTEHYAIIRELHAHHEAQREGLKQQHGEIYDQFEKVKEDLDHLNNELNKMTDSGVEMDANFSKFGYSAHVRTTDGSGSATPLSRTNTDDETGSIKDHQNRVHEGLKFFKRPVVRQYFHQGLLWRSAKSGEVGTFELFTDLLYVGIIGILGDKAVELSNGKSLLEYCINFCMAFKIWSDLTLVSNMLERDDVIQKISVCFYLVTLFGYTTNIAYAFETDSPHGLHDTYIPMISFYLLNRFYGVMYFAWLAYVVPLIRYSLIWQACVAFMAGLLWIASAQVSYPHQLPIIWIAIFIDTFGNHLGIWIHKVSSKNKTAFQRFLNRRFDFYPAINIEHRAERTNAFVSLVFGYSVLTILYQSRARIGVNAFLGKAIMGLIQAFAFQWLYFEIDHQGVHVHAIRRHWLSGMTWVTTHLPFVLSYTLAAATLSKLVLAHDCPNADTEDLSELYQPKSDAELNSGLRWFYCAGIGVALLTMTLLSHCHIHKKIAGSRLRKHPRLMIRAAIAVVIICLPAAGDRLNSVGTIAITTSLVVLTLAVDIYGNSFHGDGFWTGGWCEESKRQCKYEANIKIGKKKKGELVKALQMGEKMRLEDLRRRESSISTLNDVEGGGGGGKGGLGQGGRRGKDDEQWMHAQM